MPRSHFYRPVTDLDGNVVPNTKVTIYEAGTSALLAQTIYTQKLGSPTRTNPWVTSDGYIDLWLDRPQSIKIGLVVQGATETYIDDVSVLPPPENTVLAEHAFQVVNDGTAGYFLQAGQPGVAAWVDAGDLVNSKPSPLRAIYTYDFTGGSYEDLTFVDPAGAAVTPSFVDVAADTKPPGWTSFTQALRLPTTSVVTLRVPGMTWSETGTVIFLYKVVSANAGQGAAMLHVSVDNDLLFGETPIVADLINTWQVGYLDEIPTGTHRVAIEHRPGTDLNSYVLIGPVWLQYGNNIPAHNHEGTAAQTVRLGVGSEAAFIGATVVGSGAKALEANATAFGYDAQVGRDAVGIGAQVRAGVDGVAAGHRAATAKVGGVAIGKDASATEDYGVAIGRTALSQGAGALALGSGAQTGSAAESVALGASAKALAFRSVALGQGAMVSALHDYSIAIGPNVATTAARQAMIGDSLTTVVVPGNFRQVGGSVAIGSTGKTLGFFGSTGIVKPTVTGSRGGNATLAQLLTYLASIGLITDGTTA